MDSRHTVIRKSANHMHVLPAPGLRRAVSHYTLSFPSPQPVPETLSIVPDASGCLVFTLSESRIEALCWGPNTSMVHVENDVNSVPLRVFVEFLPGGLYGLFGTMPVQEIRDRYVSVDDLDHRIALSCLEAINCHHTAIPDLLDALDRILLARIGNAMRKPLVNAVLAEAAASHGCARMSALAGTTGYSERQINRVSLEALGMPYKSFARVVRINEACRRLRNTDVPVIDIAYDLGYCDQPHFIRDFRSLCGVSPSAFRRGMSDFYNEDIKICANLPANTIGG